MLSSGEQIANKITKSIIGSIAICFWKITYSWGGYELKKYQAFPDAVRGYKFSVESVSYQIKSRLKLKYIKSCWYQIDKWIKL